MITRNLFVALLATTVFMGGATAALAKGHGGGGGGGSGHGGGGGGATTNSTLPYICGTASPADAVSNIVNGNGFVWNQIATAAKGTDSAGFELTNNGTNNAIGTKFLTFTILGKAGSPSPMIVVKGDNGVSYSTLLKDGTRVSSVPGGASYSFSASQLTPVPVGVKVAKIDFQLDPSKTEVTLQIGGIRINGGGTSLKTTKATDTCPLAP